MPVNILVLCVILTSVAFFSIKAKKLTVPAAVTGWFIGWCVFAGTGFTGVAMIAAFFALATAATSRGMKVKQTLGLAEKDKGKRTAGQVVANAGVAAILGLMAMAVPSKADLFGLMAAGSIASATADTLSSELGNIYGKNFYNIITLKRDTRGLDGVISLEGTLAGIAGSIFIAFVYSIGFGFGGTLFSIVLAGTIGNLSDSVLGATLERKGYVGNNQVNFLNTAIAALFVLVLSSCIG